MGAADFARQQGRGWAVGRLSLGLQLVCGWPMLVFVFNAVSIMRRIFFFKLYIYKKKYTTDHILYI